MKYIVTGGGGFIGSHLTEKLIKLGHKVIVIDNFSVGRRNNLKSIKKNIKIINADINNKNKIFKYFKCKPPKNSSRARQNMDGTCRL